MSSPVDRLPLYRLASQRQPYPKRSWKSHALVLCLDQCPELHPRTLHQPCLSSLLRRLLTQRLARPRASRRAMSSYRQHLQQLPQRPLRPSLRPRRLQKRRLKKLSLSLKHPRNLHLERPLGRPKKMLYRPQSLHQMRRRWCRKQLPRRRQSQRALLRRVSLQLKLPRRKSLRKRQHVRLSRVRRLQLQPSGSLQASLIFQLPPNCQSMKAPQPQARPR